MYLETRNQVAIEFRFFLILELPVDIILLIIFGSIKKDSLGSIRTLRDDLKIQDAVKEEIWDNATCNDNLELIYTGQRISYK
jgi:hypothetical protein